MTRVILSVLGQDRPGILAAVSRVLFEAGGNIENVSQTTLQNQFAGIFIAAVPAGLGIGELASRLTAALDPMGMHVHVKPLAADTAAAECVPCEPFVITTQGPDRKGLVAEITAVIAAYGVNITNLQAVFKGGRQPGDNIMIYEVDVPADIDQQAFNRDLRQRASALQLDISIQHRNIFLAIHRI